MVRGLRFGEPAPVIDSGGYRIEPFEPRTAGDEQTLAVAGLSQAREHEWISDDPLIPLGVIVSRMRADTPGRERRMFLARGAAGRPVGYGLVARGLNEPANAHARWVELFVRPEHRRCGLGRALLGAAVESCAGEGDDLVFMGQTSDRVAAGAAFARWAAASPGLDMRTNQLTLAEVERARVAEWARLNPTGYRLERAEGVVPASLLPSYLVAANAMNDAPLGTMAWHEAELTEQQQRDREAYFRSAGIEWRLIVAVDGATGEGAGFTELQHDPRVPHLVWQGGTGVARRHRGRRLGLWMKAAMLEWVFAEWPKARFIRTGNANTNEWMLAINTQLGFRHAWSTTMWQISLAQARAPRRTSVAGVRGL